MKEKYLKRSTLEKTIADMIAELTTAHYRQREWKLRPDRAALLVLDMQNYFLDPSSHAFTPSAPTIVPNIEKLIRMARQNKMQVIFTKHVNDDNNAGMMGKWWRDMVTDGSREAEIIALGSGEAGKRGSHVRDDSMAENMIILKNQYDAFYNTDLEDYLRSREIEQVIITGVLANLCCETTARSAFVRGYEVFFPIDATAAYNKEFHLSTFRNLGFGFCLVLKTSELIHSLNEG